LEIILIKITLFLGKNTSFLAVFYTFLWKTLQVGLKGETFKPHTSTPAAAPPNV